MLSPDKVRAGLSEFTTQSNKPVNLNFFCHAAAAGDVAHEQAWLKRLAPYYAALGATPPALPLKAGLQPFGEEACALVEELRPAVASFHFGLPAPDLLARVKVVGCKILGSATSVKEAIWLAERGVDAIITQGAEAGGHRGTFLETNVAAQVGTFALVPQIADAVPVPVIAAGGIADARGVAAAFALGAAGVQIGTAYLRCPEAHISELHRAALKKSEPATVITNVLTGRPARAILNRFIQEQGPMASEALAFPPAQNDCRETRIGGLFVVLVWRGAFTRPRHECREPDQNHRRGKPRFVAQPCSGQWEALITPRRTWPLVAPPQIQPPAYAQDPADRTIRRRDRDDARVGWRPRRRARVW
jgi:nitronate monooxygenase